MVFFSLLSTAFSSIFYGFIVTAVIMVMLYVVLRSISPSIVQTPVFYITGVALAVLLLIQMTLMIGAMQAKSKTDAAESILSQLLEEASGTVSAQDSQEILNTLTDELPIIGSFIDVADLSDHEVEDIPAAMSATMKEYLTSYIWHRFWWILGIIVVACVVVMMFDKPSVRHSERRQLPNHGGSRRVGSSSRPPVNTRRRR